MKLAYRDLDTTFSEQDINIIVVEDHKNFRDICMDMRTCIDGGDGGFVLSDDGKLLNISKKGVLIGDPLDISFTDKKLINALYSELTEIALENFQEDLGHLISEFSKLFDKINAESSVSADYSCDIQFAAMLKAFGVGFKIDYESFFEKFYDYISLLIKLCQYSFIVFVNLKSYFSAEECLELYKLFKYYGIFVVSIESFCLPAYEGEFRLIIDKDFCEVIA